MQIKLFKSAMKLIKSDDKYNYWHRKHGSQSVWNITPIDQEGPTHGYVSKEYIENVKHVKFN